MAWLSGGMHHSRRSYLLHKVRNALAVKNRDFVMTETTNLTNQSVAIPSSVSLLAKKSSTRIVVYAVNIPASSRKIFNDL